MNSSNQIKLINTAVARLSQVQSLASVLIQQDDNTNRISEETMNDALWVIQDLSQQALKVLREAHSSDIGAIPPTERGHMDSGGRAEDVATPGAGAMTVSQEMRNDEIEKLASGIQAVGSILQHDCAADGCQDMLMLAGNVKGGLISAIEAMASEIQKKVDRDDHGAGLRAYREMVS